MQPQICIKLTEKQKHDIVYAIHNLTGVTLHVDPKQIDVNGDWINVSKSQANHIYKSLTKNKPFNLTTGEITSCSDDLMASNPSRTGF